MSGVVYNLNENSYKTGLELEVKNPDVEYETEELTPYFFNYSLNRHKVGVVNISDIKWDTLHAS